MTKDVLFINCTFCYGGSQTLSSSVPIKSLIQKTFLMLLEKFLSACATAVGYAPVTVTVLKYTSFHTHKLLSQDHIKAYIPLFQISLEPVEKSVEIKIVTGKSARNNHPAKNKKKRVSHEITFQFNYS